MIKQLIAIILLSIGVIMSMTYAQQGLHYLITGHDWIADALTEVFSGGATGNMVRELLALLAMPILFSLSIAIGYWIVKRTWFPHFMLYTWVLWLIQTAALVVMGQ